MSPPLQLVPSDASSPSLHHFVAELREGVLAGDIVGLGVVVMLRGRRFFVDAVGTMTRYPFEAAGLVGELEHCLREMGRCRMNTDTTR